MYKLVSVLLDCGDGSSYPKYFPCEKSAQEYVDEGEGLEEYGLPQDVCVDTFEVGPDNILIPMGGFE